MVMERLLPVLLLGDSFGVVCLSSGVVTAGLLEGLVLAAVGALQGEPDPGGVGTGLWSLDESTTGPNGW